MDYEGVVTPLGAGTRPAPTPLDPKALNEGWRRHFKARSKVKGVAVLLDVPSGEKIAAIRMPLSYMMRTGVVPDRLTGAVQRQIAVIQSGDPAKAQSETIKDFQERGDEAQAEFDALLQFIWCECVQLPKFLPGDEANPDDPDNPTFPVESVEMMDLIYLYQWCQGVNESVEDFFRTTGEALGALADVLGIPLQTE